MDQGDIITVTEVAALYSNVMHDHGIPNNNITMQVLLEKIQQNISNLTITDARGRKPPVLHSKNTGRSAIDQAIEEPGNRGERHQRRYEHDIPVF